MSTSLPRLTCADLERAQESVGESPEARAKPHLAPVLLASRIIQHFLGNDWLKKEIDPKLPHAHFFVPHFDRARVNGNDALRLTYLAELLFNLQDAEGFPELIERIRAGAVPASLTELQVGRLLRMQGLDFRFVVPRGIWGNDFDLAIVHADGTVSPGETKLKLYSAQPSEDAILGALETGRPQLPSNQPGLLFLMTPRNWFEGKDHKSAERAMTRAANEFLHGSRRRRATSRVVSVVFYAAPSFSDERSVDRIKEVSNPDNPNFPNRTLFANQPKGEWTHLSTSGLASSSPS